MGTFVKVAKAAEIMPGEARLVEIQDKRIALFNVEGNFYAIDDTCTHEGGPLSEGLLVGTEVTCPWHGAVFDITTGQDLAGPAPSRVERYEVRITGEDVEVEV
jgi:nitrite reductase/ring-hydroxylating ferredoxin subunit